MKKTMTLLSLVFSLTSVFSTKAQIMETFEGSTFTLSANSFYQNNSGNDWTTTNATFRYGWNTGFGGYWESGSAYTNKRDTVDGTFSNLYGCIADLGYNNSATYVTVQDGAVVTFTDNTTYLSGFFVTNTTYVWKTIKKGNAFSRRFGDTTGTGSGVSIPQNNYPDWFKLLVYGYKSGVKLTDSVEFYLADYRSAGTASDYVVKNWQFVNCTKLGVVDSISFKLKSSDSGAFGMNTPGFFSIDNFTTGSIVGINELNNNSLLSLHPNPTSNNVFLNYIAQEMTILTTTIYDVSGKEVLKQIDETSLGQNEIKIETDKIPSGVYLLDVNNGSTSKKIKFVKL